MTLNRQLRFWVIVLVVFIAIVWLLRGVLMPFLAGIALAYLLDPAVRRLQRIGMNRLFATITIVFTCVLVFAAGLIVVVPVIAHQVASFAMKVPEYVQQLQTLATSSNKEWLQMLLGESLPDLSKSVGEMVTSSLGWLSSVLKSLVDGGVAIVSIISLLVVTPVVAFYILYDWDQMIESIDDLLPIAHKETIRDLVRQVNAALAGFLRGQALVCLALGLFYGIGLSLVGLRSGLLIGLGAGVVSFIPFIGTISGFLVSVGVAIAQFWPNWIPIVVVATIFGVGQFLEGNILYPKLVGDSVGLHPVWLMFALVAFGALMGFVGLLIAVPIAAIIGVLIRFAIQQYKVSPVYTGIPADPAQS